MPGLYPPIGSSGGYNEQYRRHLSQNKLTCELECCVLCSQRRKWGGVAMEQLQ